MEKLPAGYPEDAFEAFAHMQTIESLSVDDLKVLAMIECYGETFYQIMASGVEHSEARALLERNGAEERGHAHRLLKAIKKKTGNDWTLPANEDNPFMALAPTEVPCNEEMLGMFEQGEVDGDLAYQAWADKESDAEVADLLRLNGREEIRHSERVIEVKRLLSAA